MLIGLVGRPNSGKSTFFKAATLANALIAPYPFTTIKPNRGMGYVKIEDLAPEFGKISQPREGYVKGEKGKWRFVPFELMDVAGLVKGASEGRGLGIEFLNDLAGADAFIHIVDMSGEFDGEGKPIENYYPGNDVEIIENELDLWYAGILKKVWKVFARGLEMQKAKFSEAVAKQFSGLKVSEDDVNHVVLKLKLNVEKPSSWTEEQVFQFAQALRKYTKPMIIAANKVDRPKGPENFEKVSKEFDYPIVPCFADGELALREADKGGLIEYIPGERTFSIKKELNGKQKEALEQIQKIMDKFGSTGVQDVLNKTVLGVLDYIAVFPIASAKLTDSKGNILPDCYLMKKGSTALDLALRVHADIGKNFVNAINIKTKQAVGKDYELKHKDVLEIMTR